MARPSFEPRRSRPRGSVLDFFKPHITRLLDTHLYSAQQIFRRLREEGYRGGVTILRGYIHRIDAGRVPKPDRREQARTAAFEWMRAVLQKESASTRFVERSAMSPTWQPCLAACTACARREQRSPRMASDS